MVVLYPWGGAALTPRNPITDRDLSEMKPLNASNYASCTRRLLTLGVAGVLSFAPLPAFGAAPVKDKTEGESTSDSAPSKLETEAAAAEVGGTVALLRFTGASGTGATMREGIQDSLVEYGYAVKGIKRTIEDAAKKNKCKEIDDACLAQIATYLNANAKTPFDFYIYGEAAPAPGQGFVRVYDIGQQKTVKRFDLTFAEGDFMLASTFPWAVARATAEYQSPAGALSADEQRVMEELDEPQKSQEQIDAENAAIAKGADGAGQGFDPQIGEQPVNLRKDFKAFCRTGPREDKITMTTDGEEDVERDMRPSCKRGPVMGYWQPRSYVALTLTALAAAGTGLMYGLAAGANGDWKDAKSALDASNLDGSDPSQNDCENNPDCYVNLAGAVSEAGMKIRKRAVAGDVLLGSTLLLGGILAIIIYQDRTGAKRFIRERKEMDLANIRIGPMLTEEGGGASFGFEF